MSAAARRGRSRQFALLLLEGRAPRSYPPNEAGNDLTTMKTFRQFLRPLAVAMAGLTAASICAAENSYHFLKEIPIGGEGGWDYLSIDAGARRLYVSHNTKVVVVDLEKDAIAGEITDTPGVHGFAI